MGRDERKHKSRRDDRREDDGHRKHRHDNSDDSRHERKRKHRRDDDDSDSERRSRKKKKHREDHSSDDDDDRKRRRRKHESSSRHKEKKRSSKSSDDKRKHKKDKKDRKEKKKATKRPDKSKMQPMGPALGRKPDKLIDPVEDYYSYHEHFWVYLYREEGIAFNDMTSEESKEAFERFAKEYNSGNLEQEYYSDKMPPEVMEESKTTKHAWSFNNVLTDREKKGLQSVQQGIRQQTEYSSKEPPELQPPPVGAAICQPTNPAIDAPTFSRKTPEEIQDERRANKRLRDHVRNVEEELQGGPRDFRERQLEKKRQQGDHIHGAARAREDIGIELSDSALYGGDDNSNRFQSALAREKARKEQRAEERANRIQELQAKEQGRQENMLEILGLKNIKPGQKITIAPRQDG